MAALAVIWGGSGAIFADDRAALLTLYDSTGGASWKNASNWLSSEPVSKWFGVSVDSDGRVRSLVLPDNGLEGEIPAALGDLRTLQVLDLSSNALNGPIPAELGDLSSLNTLRLDENGLSGVIPAELGGLVELANLLLDENEFRGQIPAQLGNLGRLRFLGLSENALTGGIPEEFGNLKRLRYLLLSRNGLTGHIPSSLGSLAQLRHVAIEDNALTGGIPDEFGDLASLRYLLLSGNDLSGPVPSSLGRLRDLRHLSIENNDFEGTLPIELANLASLEYFPVNGNEVCAPRDAAFQFWLDDVSFVGVTCPPDGQSLIDVAVAYTQAARNSLGGEARVKAEIDLLFTEANYAYSQSGIDLRLELAATNEVRYEGKNSKVDLDRLKDRADGYLDGVHGLRDAAGADIVVLLVGAEAWGSSDATCGRAFQLSDPWLSDSFSSYAFVVMRADCGARTFVHELGHIMGVAHDRYEECEAENCDPVAFPYGYGYVNQRAFRPGAQPSARWRTVMAYNNQCADAGFNCQQLVRFSNPSQNYSGDPMGVLGRHNSSQVNGPSDAARTLNLTRETLSNFRAGAIEGPPVTLFFDADTYVAAEGGNAASVTVRLTAPASGEIAIPLTVDLEGGASFEDYSGVPRRVVFDEAEHTVTFDVVASDDLVDDNAEQVVLGFGMLPSGVMASAPSTAVVALEDNDLTVQTIAVSSGAEIVLTRDGDGPWLLDGEHAQNGAEAIRNGETHVLELADSQWRLALYAVRTAAGQTAVEDGIEAIRADLFDPLDVALDGAGHLYIADSRHHRIRTVDPSGVISTLAGTGDWGFAGDGGPATAARFNRPAGLALDSNGNLYVADSGNRRVRRIDAVTRTIETVTGAGQRGSSGDGGPAASASLSSPWAIAVDTSERIYIADPENHSVRRIDPVTGIIEKVAGSGNWGYSGDGGPATQATFKFPSGIALDTVGSLYVADTWNHRVRRVDPWTGWIETFTGSDGSGYSGDEGAASEAALNTPRGIAVDARGSVYVSDTRNERVRRIGAATGIITTVAGSGSSGYSGDGEAGTTAQLARPAGLAVDATGNLYIADRSNHRVRRIDSETGTITTIAGSGLPALSWNGGSADEAQMDAPASLALDSAGNVVFIDSNRVWKLNAAGLIEKLAGTGMSGDLGDGGPSSEASFAYPQGIAVDAVGNVYVADTWHHRVRRIDAATGVIETIAGTGEDGDSGDGGLASDARLSRPEGVAVDAAGNVFVADTNNGRIRRIDSSTGAIETFAGTSSGGKWVSGGLASETQLRSPSAVAVDGEGNVYLTDRSDNRVLRVDALTRLTKAVLVVEQPDAVALDEKGNVFVGAMQRILMVRPEGGTTLVAGTGSPGFSGDGEPAAGAELSVSGVVVDRSGAVWFTDPNSRRIRVLEPWDSRN